MFCRCVPFSRPWTRHSLNDTVSGLYMNKNNQRLLDCISHLRSQNKFSCTGPLELMCQTLQPEITPIQVAAMQEFRCAVAVSHVHVKASTCTVCCIILLGKKHLLQAAFSWVVLDSVHQLSKNLASAAFNRLRHLEGLTHDETFTHFCFCELECHVTARVLTCSLQ